MSDATNEPQHEGGTRGAGGDNGGQDVPSTEQDVASGQPYDPRKDPGASGDGRAEADDPDRDADGDPDSDPDMLQEKNPARPGETRRDPAEGPDDSSAVDG